MKTKHRKKLDARARKTPPRQHALVHISAREVRELINQVGKPNRWRIDYGSYESFALWVDRSIRKWSTTRPPGFVFFKVPLYKRDCLKKHQIRLVNEITEAVLFIDVERSVLL